MSTNVHLTPELERFARDCVDSGRYNNVSEVMRAGLRLLQEAQERQQAFLDSLREAEAEADRDGYVTIEEALAEIDEIIDAAERSQAR